MDDDRILPDNEARPVVAGKPIQRAARLDRPIGGTVIDTPALTKRSGSQAGRTGLVTTTLVKDRFGVNEALRAGR